MPELTKEQAIVKLAPIHAIVRQHTSYKRVYSNKRILGAYITYAGITGNAVHGHRIKYTHCNPGIEAMYSINLALAIMGLKAHRMARTNVNGDAVPPQLEIRLL